MYLTKYRYIVFVLAAGGLLTLVMILLTTQSGRAAGPWYVAPGGNDGNDCLSPGAACATINGAIDKAASGDTIYVAGGTYTGSGNEVVLLDKGATLSGGWDSSFSQRNEESVIDGQGERAGVRVAEEATAVMDSFTVQNSLDFGIFSAGTLTVLACDVRNNSGHGIYNQNGTLTVSYSRVRDNICGADGVGLENVNGTMTIDHSLVSGNVLYDPGHSGGGGGAGIHHHNSGDTVIQNSTISNNQIVGGFNGSGIASGGYTTIAIVNSTISGNTGGGGNAIYAFVGQYDISSSTITDNEGGLVSQGGAIQLRDTLLAGNTGLDCYNDHNYPSGFVQSLGYSLIGTLIDCTTTGTDLIGVDPELAPLEAGFQPLPTHGLLPGSPAINAGDPAGCTDHLGNPLDTDQRGFPRFGRCDIGAYELQPLGFSTKNSSVPVVAPLEPVTYTITLRNDGLVDILGVRVTDTLPISLTYSPGSLVATSGIAEYADGVITWAGTVSASLATSVTFGASVGPECGAIQNQAIISGGGEIFTRTATTQVINRPPVADAGPDQDVGTLALVTLDGSGSFDPDGHLPLAYLWTQTGGPAMTLSDPIVVSPTFTAPSARTVLTLTLIVTDNLSLASAPDQVVIAVLYRVYLPLVLRNYP